MSTEQRDHIDRQGWIGVDLDGVLAVYPHSFPEIGPPIQPMIDRVRLWIAEGKHEVRIFTARVCVVEGLHDLDGQCADHAFADSQRQKIEDFCIHHFGVPLQVTATKDFMMIALYDDRCVQMISNTGEALQDRLAQVEALVNAVAD